jgi:hypothetical protein
MEWLCSTCDANQYLQVFQHNSEDNQEEERRPRDFIVGAV